MAKPVCVVSDSNSNGGIIIASNQTVLVLEGKIAANASSPVSTHPAIGTGVHAGTTTSSSTVLILEGSPATLIGDVDSCGHPRLPSSQTIFSTD